MCWVCVRAFCAVIIQPKDIDLGKEGLLVAQASGWGGHETGALGNRSSAGAQFTFFLVFNSGAQGTVLSAFRMNLPVSGNLIYKCIQSHSEVCLLGDSSFCQTDDMNHHEGRSLTKWLLEGFNSEEIVKQQ